MILCVRKRYTTSSNSATFECVSCELVLFSKLFRRQSVTIENEEDLRKLKIISRIVYETLMIMRKHLKPGMSTLELDEIGRKNLNRYGANSAPKVTYDLSLIHI